MTETPVEASPQEARNVERFVVVVEIAERVGQLVAVIRTGKVAEPGGGQPIAAPCTDRTPRQ